MMSVSSLPEWKQLLLERKRREEEERDRREKEEEDRLASMPAWKRGIIQRRRAKQEGGGERDKEREGGYQVVDSGDADSYILTQTGGEITIMLEPERPQFDPHPIRAFGRVSVENIGPIRQNPFIKSQRKKSRELEKGVDEDVGTEAERGISMERGGNRGHEREFVRGREIEIKPERFRDRSEGRERDRSIGRESGKDGGGERDSVRIKKEGLKDTDTTLFPLVPGLRTIKAENIIIIEKDRRGSEREENIIKKVVDRQKEKQEDDEEEKEEGSGGGEKRGMRVDLREFLAGGGSVTEIRATEVLIIKPGMDDRIVGAKMAIRGGEEEQGQGEGQEVQGRESRSSSENTVEGERGRLREASWAQDQELGREKASMKEPAVRPRPQAALQREEREFSSSGQNSGLLERSGRVSKLLSKFGEYPKPPSRSKSSDCFVRPSRDKSSRGGSSDDLSGGEEGQGEEAGKGALRGVPKRSFSFSDRVLCAKENGLQDDDRKALERTFSDRRTGEPPERGTKPKVLQRWRHGDKQVKPAAKSDLNVQRSVERQSEFDRDSVKTGENDMATGERADPPREGPVGSAVKMTQDEGFTMASVKNTEGIAFARRVSIRQEGKERTTERETKRNENVTDRGGEKLAERITEIDKREREMERDRMIEREKEWERQIELQVEEKKQSNVRRAEAESSPSQSMCIQSSEIVNSMIVPSSPSRVMSAVTEFSLNSQTVKEADKVGRPNWENIDSQDHLSSQTVLSHHTEELISKIGSVKDKKSDRESRRRTQTCMYVDADMTSGQQIQSADIHSPEDEVVRDSYSETMYKEEPLVLKSPKRCISVGQSTTPDDVQIPRTVFYGVDMATDRPRSRIPSTDGLEDGGREAGKGVERRESWKAGRPLNRIESLREKIRQREQERQRSRGAEGEDRESRDSRERDLDTGDKDKGNDYKDKERWKDAAQEKAAEEKRKMGWTMEGGEREGQEEPLSLTASQLDVTQEPSVSRASPQLPVPLSLLQPVVAEEQDKSVYIAATAVAYSDCTVDIEVKELTQHVEDLSGNQVWRHQDTDRPRGVGGVGEDRGEELQDEDYFPPSQTSSPRSSLSPSPPLPHSLAAMSRIYNLKAVGSRAGLCISERAVEVVSHKTLPQEDYRPFRQKLTQEPSRPKEVQVDHAKVEHPWESSDEPLSVLSVQRQVEQLRLREQEVKRQKLDERQAEKSTSSEKEMKVPQGHWREESQQHHLRSGDGQTRDRPSPTGRRTPPTPQAQPKLNQSKTFSGPSPEGARKHLERPTAPVPPSSPSSLSPSPTRTTSLATLSPSPFHTSSPSLSPSPPLISIRSASSAPGKRGTTITITPRKPVGAGVATAAAAAAPSSATTGSPSTSKPAGQAQALAPSRTGEGGKKRYPTAEEIQVIGGYQNLEKSCLVKSRGTAHKGVKVCFDEVQLERVCEYPSETSMLASFPPSPMLGLDPGREERGKGQEEEEEEEEERGEGGGGGISRNVGSGVGRVLRVDESCRR
ncbi:zinc finger CCCH domain-containing protein 13 [Clupea harengus]|uniref:Zinc finger CCCH domain-containing protein 13 n=1 Tax=Clupea harengus TaxID=7950 RepID=A0A6P8H2A4_CLUHA|nr:zinc finger CCCH domain-containing protein 13 [Clupea harengus]